MAGTAEQGQVAVMVGRPGEATAGLQPADMLHLARIPRVDTLATPVLDARLRSGEISNRKYKAIRGAWASGAPRNPVLDERYINGEVTRGEYRRVSALGRADRRIQRSHDMPRPQTYASRETAYDDWVETLNAREETASLDRIEAATGERRIPDRYAPTPNNGKLASVESLVAEFLRMEQQTEHDAREAAERRMAEHVGLVKSGRADYVTAARDLGISTADMAVAVLVEEAGEEQERVNVSVGKDHTLPQGLRKVVVIGSDNTATEPLDADVARGSVPDGGDPYHALAAAVRRAKRGVLDNIPSSWASVPETVDDAKVEVVDGSNNGHLIIAFRHPKELARTA